MLSRLRSVAPKKVVQGCFCLVFLIATTLTWREALILKETYEITQRDQLNTVSSIIDRQGQRSVDELIFFRNMLQNAIQNPVRNNTIQQQLAGFQRIRNSPVWRLANPAQHSMPINGVADSWLQGHALLERSDGRQLEDELTAALEMSIVLQLHDPARNYHSRLWYISRAGFYLSSTPPLNDVETLENYSHMVTRPYFTRMSPAINPARKFNWTGLYEGIMQEGKVITVSIPVDQQSHWYGVLAMDFSAERIRSFLMQARPEGMSGNVLLYNNRMELVAKTDDRNFPGHEFSADEFQRFAAAVAQDHHGAMRFGTRFVTWTRDRQFKSVIVNIQTLREGVQGHTGNASVVLVLMWLLFSLSLLFAYQLITRLIGRMLALQSTLSWRAHYDNLTRLLNRGAFLERAEQYASQSHLSQRPFSVIQLDLDRFKAVNDIHGHHAGDLVLSHAAGVIQSAIRKVDVVGRVGGEEFCIALPETGLHEAMDVAERVRAKLAAKEVLIDASLTLKVTASLGVASSEEQGVYDFESLQSVADGRLYLAKLNGRNRVCGEG